MRLEAETLERADRVAVELSKRIEGVKQNQSLALRLAIKRGLDVLEAEMGIAAKESKDG